MPVAGGGGIYLQAFSPSYTNVFFFLVWFYKLGKANSTYLGVSGYIKNIAFFCLKYVLKKGILWMQRLHQRTETRVCIFPGPD